MPKLPLRLGLIFLGAVVGGVAATGLWMTRQLRPMPSGPAIYIRFWRPMRFAEGVARLKDYGIVRDRAALRLYAWLHRGPRWVPVGTYLFRPGDDADQILHEIEAPIRQMMRMPETNWARRDANLLERAQVTPAKDYLALVDSPSSFRGAVDFPLPTTTLEGYLLPDTYDFPPLLGARAVVERRLKAFDAKVWRAIGKPKDLHRVVTIASLVELEAGADEDRATIAGVIENRLKQNMPLEIDASLMYGLGKWKRLHFRDYKEFKSPFNLYLHKGLPPTPICSPSLKSIEASMHPAQHHYLFYVALPGGKSLFSETYAEHRHQIKLREKALAALGSVRNGSGHGPAAGGKP